MRTEELTNNTGLNNIRMVWDIWGSTLPTVWHERLGLTAILLLPDETGRVLVALPPRRFELVDIEELVEIKPGTVVTLADKRRGTIRAHAPFSMFFIFHDDENEESAMVGMDQIVRAEAREEQKV